MSMGRLTPDTSHGCRVFDLARFCQVELALFTGPDVASELPAWMRVNSAS